MSFTFDFFLNPAVSVILRSFPLKESDSEIESLVVPGVLETIALLSFKIALK